MDAVRAALARRAHLRDDVVRLVDGRADDVDGLVVDRYGPIVRVEAYDEAWLSRLHDVADLVVADAAARAERVVAGAAPQAIRVFVADAGEAPPSSAVPATDAVRGPPRFPVVVGLHRKPRGKVDVIPLRGAAPAAHVVHEDGARYLVRCAEPDAAGAGLFVDHREGRRRVRAHAQGRPVLNLFAHAGAFGVVAALGGASRVDHVDAAKKCAPWAALNLALNGIDPKQHRFLVDDALKVLARAAKKGPQYGLIVVDPPTTAVRPDGARFHVEKHLVELADQACAALLPGGALILSTNARGVQVADVVEIAKGAAWAARRTAKLVEEIPLGADLPSRADPATRPMRGAFMILA